ncbi:conserved exported protein of unknown function (plasmid) [Rhodovastum atsumiense]|uniref:Uncharacterized protein n=1 Tax=Rhodovastum atsumiense TaxID=504468 RepID=A0A5M6IU76_9PROT|nr:hypothetical protein [Rhodovastum atsumiense]KAA5611822.1 hypothetical protein F1189_12350 [Rhodovastum atsumiense]CAH2606067.1 conserved exported protein of unknown function [Rhodovastum atsumiense]
MTRRQTFALSGLCAASLATQARAADMVIPAGYAVAQHFNVDKPGAPLSSIVLFEDVRIDRSLRATMWGTSSDPMFILTDQDPGRAEEFSRNPPLPALLRFLTPEGRVSDQRALEHPLAQMEMAAIRGVKVPVMLLTVDGHSGVGSYNGWRTTVLRPTIRGLEPDTAKLQGSAQTLALTRTGKASWRIVPTRDRLGEEIQQVRCFPAVSGPGFVMTFITYRVAGDGWMALTRQEPGFWESDQPFPEAQRFP